jgi:hypothetical protein
MKFIIYISALVLILSIFTTIDAKRTNKILQHHRKRINQMSSGSNHSNLSHSQSSFSNNNPSSVSSSTVSSSTLSNPHVLHEEELHKKPVSQMSIPRAHVTSQSRPTPTNVSYEPRELYASGPRYVSGHRPYGIMRRRFPVWLGSYAIVRRTLDECPEYNETLQFAKSSPGLCVVICDKLHCIQTLNHCCYYVEPEKYGEVGV